MKRIEHFVPGQPAGDDQVLAALRWPVPAGVTQAYVKAYTEPSEVVLVPYCQGSAAIREIVAAGRRVLAINFDPALILGLQATLAPPSARDLDAAVARLGDNLKQGVPLRRYLTDLYATTCPACLRPAVADYFVWDREQGVPITKQLRCPACAWDGRTAVGVEDRERLAAIPARGMHYYYVLDRVAPRAEGDGLRARLELLLELYSPRNLYALAELTLRIESLFPTGPLNRALKAVLLDCLDRCSSLLPVPNSAAHRRGLSRPAHFLERNVWQAFEEAVARLQTLEPALPGLTYQPEALGLPAGDWTAFVGLGLVRDLPRLVPPRSIRLILTSPPALDSAVWSLTYLWSAWLLGAEAAAPLRPLLRQRTPDPAWYARVMGGSFSTLADLLRDDGRLVLVLTGQRPSVVEALLLAAGSARLGVAGLVQSASDYRLELTATLPQPAPGRSLLAPAGSPAPLETQIRETALQAALDTIRARGEPVPWRSLHAAIQQRLAETGLLARSSEMKGEVSSPLALIAEQVQAALDGPSLEHLSDGERGQELWWLVAPVHVASPLCDRVEAAAHRLLASVPALSEVEFAEALFVQFPGPLTPDTALVAACLRSLGHESAPGVWQLRAEDRFDARQAERQVIVEHLLALGERLAFRAVPWGSFDVAWFEDGKARAVFVVRWLAALSEALARSAAAAGAQPYLVIPGGRAALVSYKLAHNPLWRKTVDEAGWRFIKYRHVRQLAAQPDVDEYSLRTIVGLDPIVEREAAQIPLF
jgi:hypothetical protein